MSPSFHAALIGIAQRAGKPCYYNQIINNINAGHSLLIMSEGWFVVFHPFIRDGDNHMLIEAAWCNTGRGLYDYLSAAEDYCRDVGCKTMEFKTVRHGFERLARRFGFEKVKTDGVECIWRKIL